MPAYNEELAELFGIVPTFTLDPIDYLTEATVPWEVVVPILERLKAAEEKGVLQMNASASFEPQKVRVRAGLENGGLVIFEFESVEQARAVRDAITALLGPEQ